MHPMPRFLGGTMYLGCSVPSSVPTGLFTPQFTYMWVNVFTFVLPSQVDYLDFHSQNTLTRIPKLPSL